MHSAPLILLPKIEQQTLENLTHVLVKIGSSSHPFPSSDAFKSVKLMPCIILGFV